MWAMKKFSLQTSVIIRKLYKLKISTFPQTSFKQEQSEIFKVLWGKKNQSKVLYLAKLSFKGQEEIKILPDK